ncbi:uncharacterized protein EDB91DRAFT_1112981 [Suillus paluster]|uniref:uncharacterized protein n=1 Tax=Suillus paluster TaxID=48578 RepID=UPI001B85FB14|nr:uncharacterized protein EDB91DRAFT_1112981 [Suillus paluster]KAG1748263.1 hypothetical protein EDB91DRAFT_1112981 [Suillus paluster]
MTPPSLVHILSALKKWFLRLTRRSASLFFLLLSSLRRSTRCHAQPQAGNSRLISQPRLSSGFLLRALEVDIAGDDVPICFSLLPPASGPMGEPSSHSDDPYTGTHSRDSRPLCKGTGSPPLEANPTTTGYPNATESSGLHQGSMSSLHLSLQMGESSVGDRTILNDQLQESSSPGTSRHSDFHELPRPRSRSQGYMDNTHSINTTRGAEIIRPVGFPTRVNSMKYLSYTKTVHSRPHLARSAIMRRSTDTDAVGRVSVGTDRSLTRSIATSESRQVPYRTHKGRVGSHPVSVHSVSIHHGSPHTIFVPLASPIQAVSISDPGSDHRRYDTAPPGSPERLGSEVALPMVYDGGPPIGLLVAEEVRRREEYIPRSSVPSRTAIPAMTVKFPVHDAAVPPGWTKLVHPQGCCYFVHQEKRTFTQMNICEKDVREKIEYYMQYLLYELHKHGDLELDMSQVDLVLEPKVFSNGDTIVGCYYFANHRDRCLFWLDEYNTEDILSDCSGVENLSHIRLAIQAQYWKHCEYFPCLCPVTQDLVDEVKDMLLYAKCDHLSSRQSTASFDLIEIRDYLSIVDKIKVYSSIDQKMQRCHAAIVIGRIMYAFSRNHFVNSHGESSVRLTFEQTVHPYTPSLLIVVLAPFLFLDPLALVRELHTTFIDNTPSSERWNAFNAKLNGQLQDSTLLATVLLNANVGFLAINTVDMSGRSPTQVASYMSLVASLGSMIIGLLLVSHTRTLGQGTVLQGEVFLSGLGEKERRLERLAIIYSLPKTLLMWGMIFFFAAFSINWWGPGDRTSRAVVGSVILLALVVISFGVIRTSSRGDRWWRQTKLIFLELFTSLADAWKQLVELMGMKKGQRDDPQSHAEGINPFPIAGADASILPGFQPEIPGSDHRENHPNSSIPPTRQYRPTTSMDSPQQPHDANSTQPSSDLRPSPGFLSGTGSLQRIREDIQNVFRDKSTMGGYCEPDAAPLGMHFTTSPNSGSEWMVGTAVDAILHSDALPTATDTGTSILPGPSRTEERERVEYTDNIVEEPGELDDPQRSPSTTLPPRIFAKNAPDDYFHHAPNWTLQEGHDLEECED